MKNYLIINHSDGTTAPAGQAEWGKYFEVLKDNLVDGGKPITKTQAVIKDNKVTEASDTVVGYTILKAESLDEATELVVKASPLANKPGCEVRVYEMMQM